QWPAALQTASPDFRFGGLQTLLAAHDQVLHLRVELVKEVKADGLRRDVNALQLAPKNEFNCLLPSHDSVKQIACRNLPTEMPDSKLTNGRLLRWSALIPRPAQDYVSFSGVQFIDRKGTPEQANPCEDHRENITCMSPFASTARFPTPD